MDGVNQNSQPAPANPPPENSGNQQKVAEGQAEDFAKKMGKKKDGKNDAKKSDKEELSLSSLFAERSKRGQDADRLKREQGEGQGGERDPGELLGMNQEKGSEHAQGIREAQANASVAEVKSIDKVSGPKEINEVINKLVDKIHVSAKDSINGAEVRITMKENILPGTEIRIQRMGGELTVTMNTTSADTHNFLAVNEASLAKSLNERFGDKVQVNINLSGGDQPGDGRSREQYEGEQEQEDNDE